MTKKIYKKETCSFVVAFPFGFLLVCHVAEAKSEIEGLTHGVVSMYVNL